MHCLHIWVHLLLHRDPSNVHLCMLNVPFIVNGLYGKPLNLASEEVILELVSAKCTPILLYGLECFQLGKADLQFLGFTFNRLCMKIFKTESIDVVKYCLNCFAIDPPSCIFKRGRISSYYDTNSTVNGFCKFCSNL